MIGKSHVVGRGEVVRVHHEPTHARRMQMIEGVGDERPVKHRDEGLRELLRQRTQPLADARAEDEGLGHAPLLHNSLPHCNCARPAPF